MSRYQIEKELEAVNMEIANHHREWYDALGTCFEHEDWQRKVRRKEYLQAALLAAQGDLSMIDDYGHYGKGTEGYIHYKQETDKYTGGGGGGPNRGGGGVSTGTIVVLIGLFLLTIIEACAS